MRIVVVGAGKVGRSLIKQLSEEGHELIVVDSDPEIVNEMIEQFDILGVCGNGARYEVQREAEVGKADLLIACTSNDEVNILACLVAKKLGAEHTIARVRNPEYEVQLRIMRQELGLSTSINPEKAVAREIARVLRFPNAMKLESFSKRRLDLIEFRLEEDMSLVGMQVKDLVSKYKVRVLICAVARDKEVYIPSGEFVLEAGDIVYLTASPADMERFFRTMGFFKERARNVMIVGASKMSYYLAEELTAADMSVRIIDSDEERCHEFAELLPKALVIVGDATDSELLNEEGLTGMDAFVSLTGLDETNILLCLYAKDKGVDKVIAKINRASFSEFASSGQMIDTVVSTGTVVADLTAQYVRAMESSKDSNFKALHRIADGRVEALEFGATEDTSFVGTPLKDLNLRKNLLIGGIVRRNGQILIPGGNDAIEDGDDVIIVTTDQTLKDIEDILA